MIPKLDEYKNAWKIQSANEIKPGLERIKWVLEKLGNPERQLNCIHVAGTNGKGSTIAFMESILLAQGYSVGVFSSPAIIDIHDQIRINGTPILPARLHESFQVLQQVNCNGLLTNFELLTAVAFVAFHREQVDYVLIETGMGGKSDSTNVVLPKVSVITSIALDHQAFLGDKLTTIAAEKAGIIKKETPVVVGLLEEEVLGIVKQVAEEQQSPLFIYGQGTMMEEKLVQSIPLQMKGPHQQRNAVIALKALKMAQIPLQQEHIERGLLQTHLPHRFEEVATNLFVDGAHNPAAAIQLRETIEEQFPGGKVDFIIGMLKGKDYLGVFEVLQPVANSFTFVSFNHPEAVSAEQLLHDCSFPITSTIAVEQLKDRLQNRERLTIITGSLYLLASLFER